jgi:hypothetical protein
VLARRKAPRMRQDAPQCAYPRHRKYVRGRVCIVPGCLGGPIEAAHVRAGLPAGTPSWARGGTGKKPHDAFTFPACSFHHRSQHVSGEISFARTHGVSLLKEALELARNSPCPEVRAFAFEVMK